MSCSAADFSLQFTKIGPRWIAENMDLNQQGSMSSRYILQSVPVSSTDLFVQSSQCVCTVLCSSWRLMFPHFISFSFHFIWLTPLEPIQKQRERQRNNTNTNKA